MKEITLTITIEEATAILNVLGELPSKTGAWPLIIKLKGQLEEQVPQTEE